MAPHPTARSLPAVLPALMIVGLVFGVCPRAVAQSNDAVEVTPGMGGPSATPGTAAPTISGAELAPAEPTPADGGSHRITSVTIEYASENADHPSSEQVLMAKVPLLETPEGFVAPREGYASAMVTLADIPALADQMFFDSALAVLRRRWSSACNSSG